MFGSKKSPVKLYTNFFTYILRKSCNLGCTAELRTNVLLKLLTQMINSSKFSKVTRIPPSLDQNLALAKNN